MPVTNATMAPVISTQVGFNLAKLPEVPHDSNSVEALGAGVRSSQTEESIERDECALEGYIEVGRQQLPQQGSLSVDQ